MERIYAVLLSIMVALAACGSNKVLNAPETPVVDEGDSVAAKLVVTKNKVGGTCEKCGGVRIFKNTAMTNANQPNPTAVRGATNIKVMSIVVALDARKDYYIDNLSVVSALPGWFVLGRTFHNLKVFSGSTQIGSTLGTLPDPPSEFRFGHTAPMSASTQMVLDFYADISSSATDEDLRIVNENPYGPLAVLSIEAVGMLPRDRLLSNNRGIVWGQRVYIAEHGTVLTEAKPLPSYQLPDGLSSQVVLCRFSQTATAAEDMARSSFWVNISSGQCFLQQNWHWYVNGARMSPTEYTLQFFSEAGSIATIFNNDLIFARGTETVFELRDDTIVTPDALAQNNGQWELTARLLPGTAFGMTSAIGVAVQGGDPQTHIK